MVAQPSPPLMSVEEYLELECHSDVKHEYIDGHVYAMAGGTSAQSVISANIIALLRPHLRGGPCRVRTSDMRVRLSATRYVYPDVSVSCDERNRVNSEQDEIHYPRLVVEVLSRTTQDYDRTDKFDLYRGCAELQDYVLVSTRRQSVHVYSRGADGVWLLRPFGPGDDVLLPSIDFRAPIAAFFEDVELPTSPEIRP